MKSDQKRSEQNPKGTEGVSPVDIQARTLRPGTRNNKCPQARCVLDKVEEQLFTEVGTGGRRNPRQETLRTLGTLGRTDLIGRQRPEK